MNTNQQASLGPEDIILSEKLSGKKPITNQNPYKRYLWISLILQFIWPVLYCTILSIVMGIDDLNVIEIAVQMGHILLLFPILIVYFLIMLFLIYAPVLFTYRSEKSKTDRYWTLKCMALTQIAYVPALIALYFTGQILAIVIGHQLIGLTSVWLWSRNQTISS